MTAIFVGGSRNISRLTEAVRGRLDKIVERNLSVLVGDANGADKAVQAYLRDKAYPNVVVFCTGPDCRNNLGHWPLHRITPRSAGQKKDRKFFALKDAAMTQEATHGFMLWDAESLGTLANVVRLMKAGKASVLYVAPHQTFVELRGEDDAELLNQYCSPALLEQARRQVESEAPPSPKVSDSASLRLL